MERFKIYIYRANIRAARRIKGRENDIFRVAGDCYDLELVSKTLELSAEVHALRPDEVPRLPQSVDSGETFGILEQSELEATQRARQQRLDEMPTVRDDSELQKLILDCVYKGRRAKAEVFTKTYLD